RLAVLARWLPTVAAGAASDAPVALHLQVGLEPGNRLAGRADAQLGDLVTLEGVLSLRDGLLRLAELRGAADLGFAAALAGLADSVRGRAEIPDGEVSWSSDRGGWPEARADLRLSDVGLPASLTGTEVRLRSLETRLVLEPREGRAVARGELHGE